MRQDNVWSYTINLNPSWFSYPYNHNQAYTINQRTRRIEDRTSENYTIEKSRVLQAINDNEIIAGSQMPID